MTQYLKRTDDIMEDHNQPQSLFLNFTRVYPPSMFINPIPSYYLCTKCKNVAQNACTDSNHKLYCHDCLTNDQIDNGFKNESYINDRIINQKTIRCPTKGCLSIVKVGKLVFHLNHECSMALFTCLYCKNMNISQYDVKKHVKECTSRPIECTVCKKEFQFVEMVEHTSSNTGCANYIQCTNDDCKVQVSKNQLDHHLKDECSNRILSCAVCKENETNVTFPAYLKVEHETTLIHQLQFKISILEQKVIDFKRKSVLKENPNSFLSLLRVGVKIDCLDTYEAYPVPKWRIASIRNIITDHVEFGTILEVSYNGWDGEYNDWIRYDSYRIRPLYTFTFPTSNTNKKGIEMKYSDIIQVPSGCIKNLQKSSWGFDNQTSS